MRKIPANIISGFLGSGKTTAIIGLLEQKPPEECWAIVVNEFGKVSIDGQTLQSKSASGSVFDILGGCICCSAKIYLKENLEKIVETEKFDRIVIEPSGLGGIEMVSEMVGLIPALSLMPVVCIVDITSIENPQFKRIPIYSAQIRMADRIVFSKGDLVMGETEMKRLMGIFKVTFPDKPTYQKNEINQTTLLNADVRDNHDVNKYQQFLLANTDLTDGNYQQKYYNFDRDNLFDLDKLSRFFVENPSIVRGKGHLRTNNGWKLVHYTLSGFTFEPCQEKEQNELVIIADQLTVDLTQILQTGIESVFD